jgi:hypothetical protein
MIKIIIGWGKVKNKLYVKEVGNGIKGSISKED